MDGALCGLDENERKTPCGKERKKKEKEIWMVYCVFWMNSVEPKRKNLMWQRKKRKKRERKKKKYRYFYIDRLKDKDDD